MAKVKQVETFSIWHKPDFTTVVRNNPNFKSNYYTALQYAHYELSSNDLKKEIIKWLKSLNSKHPLLDRIKNINEHRFVTFGKYALILNNRGELPEEIDSKFMKSFTKMIDDEELRIAKLKLIEQEKDAEPSKLIMSIQDRIKEKCHDVAGEIEGWIDDLCTNKDVLSKTVEDFVNLYKSTELKAPHAKYMKIIFARRAAEISEVVSGQNKELSEGYSKNSKSYIKKLNIFYKNLLTACDMMQEVAKAIKVPRIKKPISHDKMIAKLKYMKEDKTLGIASINPINIIGAQSLWIYDTKKRNLILYKSADIDGFGVKGTSLLNISSESKGKLLRKPPETLAEFKKANKVKLRTFFNDIKSIEKDISERLNENCIILRADK